MLMVCFTKFPKYANFKISLYICNNNHLEFIENLA